MSFLTALVAVFLTFFSCTNPCTGVGCLNDGVCNQGNCLCPSGFTGTNCETPDPSSLPEIKCGLNWTTSCFNQHWTTAIPTQSSMHILPTGYNNTDCILLVNPHPQNAPNPESVTLNSVVANIKEGQGYKVSCMAKIKGYPDALNTPGFAFYCHTNQNWYGEHYYATTGGQFHFSDWSEHSYTFVGGEENTVKFQLYTKYDSVWIADLKIEEF